MIDLHLIAFAPRWRFLYVVRIDAYVVSADLQLAERKTFHYLCKIEKEPEPVIVEDLRALALSLTNNIWLRSKK